MNYSRECRNGENCKFLKENKCWFQHHVKRVEAPVTEIKKSIVYEKELIGFDAQGKASYKWVVPVKKEEEKMIGGFPVSMLKADARSTMKDEEYAEFERAIEKGASESLIVMMMYTADQRHERRKKEEMTL